MSFDTSWDIDYYKTDYESDDHWQLRRSFMEAHKDKFPEDELVCLAQVFTNVEFLGCKYPDETMRQVAELSEEIAKDFREERGKKLKRTFVKASDAAGAKAKGRSHQAKISPVSQQFQSEQSSIETGNALNEPPTKNPKLSKYKNEQDLLRGLPFGQFILFLTNDRNAIMASGKRSNVEVGEKESICQDQQKKCEIFVGKKFVSEAIAPSMKVAKANAFETAIKKLQEECYTIKRSPNADRIKIIKDNKSLICSLAKSLPELDSNNIGFKMMQKLGWTGGGLGLNAKDSDKPFDYLIKNNRRGFGDNTEDIDTNYFNNLLDNYLKSDEIRDLAFETGFTKEERASLHKLAATKDLKSSSTGKHDSRYLVISKKHISMRQILFEVLINKNPTYINKYDVTVPIQKMKDFPDFCNSD